MSLYTKMYAVMTDSDGLKKDLSVGSGSNSYRAIGEKEVLNMLKPLFKKHKLIVFPIDGTITENNSTFDATYKGDTTTKTRNVTQIKVNFKIVDIDTGESEVLVGFGNGADSQDKGSGKSFTYAYKTMLSKTFMLFSGEDADLTHSDDIGNPPIEKGDEQLGNNKISTVKVSVIKNLMKKAGTNETSFLKWAGVKTTEDILVKDFVECTMQLEKAVKAHEVKK